jgi:hypothetical protein
MKRSDGRATGRRSGWVGAVFFALGLLAGCAELPKAPPARAVYDLGPPAEPLAGSPAWSDVVLVVGTPPWMIEREMTYRLSWDDPQLRRSYSGSRWAASPAELLALRWQQRLSLAAPGEGGRCQLRLRVDEFAQVFSSPQASEARLVAAAILVDAGGRALARLRLAETGAGGSDAGQGAQALAAAADAAAGTLLRWLESHAGSCR